MALLTLQGHLLDLVAEARCHQDPRKEQSDDPLQQLTEIIRKFYSARMQVILS